MTNEEKRARNWQVACIWFYEGGREGMSKEEQVAFLINECGYLEEVAMDVVFGHDK